MAEVIDMDAQRGNIRREGIFYGINGFILRLGVSVQSLFLYIVLHSTHFRPNAAGHASVSVENGFRILISLIPMILLMVAYLVIRHHDVPESQSSTP
jgi:GPH family glycoside/pentoside/hexuronide:cation symporter